MLSRMLPAQTESDHIRRRSALLLLLCLEQHSCGESCAAQFHKNKFSSSILIQKVFFHFVCTRIIVAFKQTEALISLCRVRGLLLGRRFYTPCRSCEPVVLLFLLVFLLLLLSAFTLFYADDSISDGELACLLVIQSMPTVVRCCDVGLIRSWAVSSKCVCDTHSKRARWIFCSTTFTSSCFFSILLSHFVRCSVVDPIFLATCW